MKVREMRMEDIAHVLPLYLGYYNGREEGCWTEETAGRRIAQVLGIQDGYSLLMTEGEAVLGFAMGYFKQYDDCVGYTLEEIVIDGTRQHQGYGSALLTELERRVREKGAACVELQAVNDLLHDGFYGKAGYGNAKNFVMKVKWFD